MSLEALAALLLIAAGLVSLALWHSKKAARQIKTLEAELHRAEVAGQEQAARIAALETLRDSSQLAEHAIATGTAVVKEVHKGIADIPFSVLEAIAATRAPAKVLRGLHDSISEGVYGALGNLNKAVGRELRKGFEAESFASTARVGLEPRPAFGSSGAGSEPQSPAMDDKPDSAPAGQTDTDAAAEPSGESSPPSVPPPKSWG